MYQLIVGKAELSSNEAAAWAVRAPPTTSWKGVANQCGKASSPRQAGAGGQAPDPNQLGSNGIQYVAADCSWLPYCPGVVNKLKFRVVWLTFRGRRRLLNGVLRLQTPERGKKSG
jgi:hypothetical protein